MTHCYYETREQIYAASPKRKLKRDRTFQEMKKLFRPGYWFISIFIMLCPIAYLILLLLTNIIIALIPIAILIALVVLIEVWGEKGFNAAARKEELRTQRKNHDKYRAEVKKILRDCRICSEKQFDALKTECKERVATYSQKWDAIQNKIYEVFVFGTLGSFIAVVINEDLKRNALLSTIAFIFLGMLVIVACKGLQKALYYIEGYFKDQYLLDALNELEYYTE